MIGSVIWLLGKFGLAESAAKKVAPWAAAALFALLVVAGWSIFDHFNDRAAIEQDRLESNVEQLEGQVAADTKAADQRMADLQAQQEQEKALDNAIENPLPGDSDDPHVRLACERLRRDGQDTSNLPTCGGR